MRIIKLSRYNLQPLEDELDRIGLEKHDTEPRLRTMPSLDFLEEELGYDFGGDEDDC